MRCLSSLMILSLFLFLASSLYAEESEMVFYNLEESALEQINAFRKAPLKFFEEFLAQQEQKSPLSPEEKEELKARYEILKEIPDLPQLRLSTPLTLAAQEFLKQAVANLSFAHLLPDGSVPETRVKEQGYEPLLVGESLALLGFENFLSPEEALSIVLDWLYQGALWGKEREAAPLLFPYEDFGMAMAGVRISFEGKTYNFYLFCYLFALPKDYQGPFFFGRFYDDRDGNLLWVPEEGLGGAQVVYKNLVGQEIERTVILPDGTFFLKDQGAGVLQLLCEEACEGDLVAPVFEVYTDKPFFFDLPKPGWLNLANYGQN